MGRQGWSKGSLQKKNLLILREISANFPRNFRTFLRTAETPSLTTPLASGLLKKSYRLRPSPHFWPLGIFQGRGGGESVYIEDLTAGFQYAPLSYTSPIPRRVFSGKAIRIWPRKKFEVRKSHLFGLSAPTAASPILTPLIVKRFGENLGQK